MLERTFRCQLITPESSALDVRAVSCALTAHDGEIGILPNHAPLLCKLGIGQMRLTAEDGARLTYYIDGGFAEVADNHLSVLTQQAIAAADLSADRAGAELSEARERHVRDPEAAAQRELDMRRAQVKLKLAKHA